MQKPIAFLKWPVKNKMNMRVHKAKCENQNIMLKSNSMNSIHPILEIFVRRKDGVNGISVSVKMPTISYGDGRAFDIRLVYSEIRINSVQVFISYHHHISLASSSGNRVKVLQICPNADTAKRVL